MFAWQFSISILHLHRQQANEAGSFLSSRHTRNSATHRYDDCSLWSISHLEDFRIDVRPSCKDDTVVFNIPSLVEVSQEGIALSFFLDFPQPGVGRTSLCTAL